jgi:hypothetical protein
MGDRAAVGALGAVAVVGTPPRLEGEGSIEAEAEAEDPPEVGTLGEVRDCGSKLSSQRSVMVN